MTQNIDAIEVTKASPTFTIRLSSNPKSDVRWFLLDNNASFFPSIKQKTIVVSDNTAYEEWTFTLSRSAFKYPHVAQLRFVYAKPQDMSSLTLTQTEQKIFTIAIVS